MECRISTKKCIWDQERRLCEICVSSKDFSGNSGRLNLGHDDYGQAFLPPQFLTLRGSDERVRLIPVLTTILKLSPAEVETVQKAINGNTAKYAFYIAEKVFLLNPFTEADCPPEFGASIQVARGEKTL